MFIPSRFWQKIFRNPQRRPIRNRAKPRVEVLEARLAPANYNITVNDLSGGLDNPTNVTVGTLGPNVTLGDAINAANNTNAKTAGNTYTISFAADLRYGTIDLTTTTPLNNTGNFSTGSLYPSAGPTAFDITGDITIVGSARSSTALPQPLSASSPSKPTAT